MSNASLTKNLVCQNSPGVAVGASGITIDLKGFTLRGDRSPGHYGIDDAGGFDGVTVKNGVVRNFQYGALGSNGADSVSVADILAAGNLARGIYVVGDFAAIKSSTASGNADIGIVVSGDSAQIQSATVLGNGNEGIQVSGDGASVKSSTASGTGAYGIHVVGNSAQIQSSTTVGNATYGIFVVGTNAAHGNDDPPECLPTTLC